MSAALTIWLAGAIALASGCIAVAEHGRPFHHRLTVASSMLLWLIGAALWPLVVVAGVLFVIVRGGRDLIRAVRPAQRTVIVLGSDYGDDSRRVRERRAYAEHIAKKEKL